MAELVCFRFCCICFRHFFFFFFCGEGCIFFSFCLCHERFDKTTSRIPKNITFFALYISVAHKFLYVNHRGGFICVYAKWPQRTGEGMSAPKKMAQSNKCICNAKLEHTTRTHTGSDPAARTPGDCCICPRPPPTAHFSCAALHSTEVGVGRALFMAGVFL